jgi:hypothetical protein
MKFKTAISFAFLAFTSITWSGSSTYDFKVNVHGQGQPMLLIPGLSNTAEAF